MNCQLNIFERWKLFKFVFVFFILAGVDIDSAKGSEYPDPILLPVDMVKNSEPFSCYYGNSSPIGGNDYGPEGTQYKGNVSPVNINVESGVAEIELALSGGSKKFAVCRCGVSSGSHQLYFTVPDVSGTNVQVASEGFGNGEYSIRVNDDDGNAVAYVMPYIWIYRWGGASSYVPFSDLYQKTATGNIANDKCQQLVVLLDKYSVPNKSEYQDYADQPWQTLDYRSSYGSKFLIKFANNVERAFAANFHFDLYMGFGTTTGYVPGHPFAKFSFNLDINPINQCTTGLYIVNFGTLSQKDIEAGVPPKDVEVSVDCSQDIGDETIQLSFDAERSSLSLAEPVVKLTNYSSGEELNVGVLILGDSANDPGQENNMLLVETGDKRIDGEVADDNKLRHSFNFTAQLVKLNDEATELGIFTGYATLMLSYK